MRNRKKVLTVTAAVLLAAGLAAGLVLAQDAADTGVTAPNESTTMLSRIAAILGIEESTLADAFEQARLESLDEAVAAGTITEEQAEAMKAGIAARSALRDVIDGAIESGDLTQEQADLLGQRLSQGRQMGQRGLQGGMQGLRGAAQDSRGFGFMLRTPRGTMGGGVWGRCR
jgi:polyhydroxyalkanoate synthesis regulator phasin